MFISWETIEMLKRLEELVAKHSELVDKTPPLKALMQEQQKIYVAISERATQTFELEIAHAKQFEKMFSASDAATLPKGIKQQIIKKYYDTMESATIKMCDSIEGAIASHLASLSRDGNSMGAQKASHSSGNDTNAQPAAAASAAAASAAAAETEVEVASAEEDDDDIYAQSAAEIFLAAHKALGPVASAEEIDHMAVALKAYTIDPDYHH